MLLIESLVFGLLGRLGDTFQGARELFPVANSEYLQHSFGQVGGIVGIAIGQPSEPDATHGTVVLLAWIVGIAVVSGILVRRRDVI